MIKSKRERIEDLGRLYEMINRSLDSSVFSFDSLEEFDKYMANNEHKELYFSHIFELQDMLMEAWEVAQGQIEEEIY